jgi:hypothetical protein
LLSVLEHRIDLIETDAWKPLDEILDPGASLHVLKKSTHGNAGSLEDPSPTYLVGVTLDSRTLASIDHPR